MVTVKVGDCRRTKMTLTGPCVVRQYKTTGQYWEIAPGETVELEHVEYFVESYFCGQADWQSQGFEEVE